MSHDDFTVFKWHVTNYICVYIHAYENKNRVDENPRETGAGACAAVARGVRR